MSGIHSIFTLLAAAPAPGPGAPPNPLIQLLPFILLFAAMYFLIIRPQQKRQKEHDAMLKALDKGDAIVTNGGIIGTIQRVKDDRFVVDIGKEMTVELHRAFVHAKIDKDKPIQTTANR